MNNVADRAADAEYGRHGGKDVPGCLRHQVRWRLEWNGKRVTSVTSDALNWIQEDLPWRELSREQGCNPEAIDVQATKDAVGYTGIAVRRAQKVHLMWDFFFCFLEIYNLHAYAFALGLPCTQAFRQYPAGPRQNRYRHSRCVILTRRNL